MPTLTISSPIALADSPAVPAVAPTASAKLSVAEVAREFDVEPGYLAAATCGVPPRRAVSALQSDLDRWRRGVHDPRAYDGVVARTRAAYARLVGVTVDRVAIGSQTSALVANAAAIRFYRRLGFAYVEDRWFGADHCAVHRLDRARWVAAAGDAV